MANLTLSLFEFIFLMICGVIVGLVIYYMLSSRRALKEEMKGEASKTGKELENWKHRYFNDLEAKDRELELLRKQLADIQEEDSINSIEAEEAKKENKHLKEEIAVLKEKIEQQPPAAATTITGDDPGYMEQLQQARNSLLEHNEKINRLLGQIDIVKETEQKQQAILRTNEELNHQVEDLRGLLSDKEKEINNIRQKAHLTSEMTSMLNNAYTDFNELQSKMVKLEQQVNGSKKISMEHEDLKEQFYRVTHDFEEQKIKYNAAHAENQELKKTLEENEEKFRDTSFQLQQYQKRVAYLEELNNDLQIVTEANKKLEGQIRRIGELESMLNVVQEERDELAKKQGTGI